jgi:hypothetical protein
MWTGLASRNNRGNARPLPWEGIHRSLLEKFKSLMVNSSILHQKKHFRLKFPAGVAHWQTRLDERNPPSFARYLSVNKCLRKSESSERRIVVSAFMDFL